METRSMMTTKAQAYAAEAAEFERARRAFAERKLVCKTRGGQVIAEVDPRGDIAFSRDMPAALDPDDGLRLRTWLADVLGEPRVATTPGR